MEGRKEGGERELPSQPTVWQIPQISVCSFWPKSVCHHLCCSVVSNSVRWNNTHTHTHTGNPPISGKAGAARTEVCKFWSLSWELEAREAKVHLWLKLQRVKPLSFKSFFLVSRISAWQGPVNQGAQHMVYRWGRRWLPLLWPSRRLGCLTNGLTRGAASHTCWLNGRPSVDNRARVFASSVCPLNIQVVVSSTSCLLLTAWGDKEGKKSFNQEQGTKLKHRAGTIRNQPTDTHSPRPLLSVWRLVDTVFPF